MRKSRFTTEQIIGFGETHGCIETRGALLNDLIQLRSAGVRSINVLVNYPGYVPTGY
jgi:hypothetical protein